MIRVSWNRGSWVRGEQAATTMRFRLFSRMTSAILSWVSWEQVNMFSATNSTKGRFRANSATSGTRTTPPMFMPQLQTKTPMRGGSPEMSRAGISFFSRTSVSRAGASLDEAALAAALASITDAGMSLGPVKTPQA